MELSLPIGQAFVIKYAPMIALRKHSSLAFKGIFVPKAMSGKRAYPDAYEVVHLFPVGSICRQRLKMYCESMDWKGLKWNYWKSSTHSRIEF